MPLPPPRRFAFVPRLLAACLLATVWWVPAWAASPERPGTRALGMGGALRSAATGDAGPVLNPSGMSLTRAYTLEAAYQRTTELDANFGHVSVVDSTSGLGLAGGLFYTYLGASPGVPNVYGANQVTGHQGGLALSLPFGDKVSLGATLRYLRLKTKLDQAAPLAAVENTEKGFTVDAGLTIRPVSLLSIGLVAYSLAELETPLTRRAFGGGISLLPIPNLLVAVDVVWTLLDAPEDSKVSVMGGVEYSLTNRLAVRAGGGRDAVYDHGYLSGGLSLLAEAGALDLGVRHDVSGPAAATYIAVSGRLFVPTP